MSQAVPKSHIFSTVPRATRSRLEQQSGEDKAGDRPQNKQMTSCSKSAQTEGRSQTDDEGDEGDLVSLTPTNEHQQLVDK